MKYIFFLLLLAISTVTFSQSEKENIKVTEDSDVKSFVVLDEVPIYKGCNESTKNSALRKCMNSKISDLISNNFNSEIANNLGLPIGNAKIFVTYMIDKEGNVINIKAKAPHPKLEEEAIRVIKLIPQMKPGMIRGKPVVVPYSLPIIVEVKHSKNTKDITSTPEKFPVYKGCNENLDFESLKKCTTKKIMNFVKMSFNIELADKLFPQDKSTSFKADFIINKKGKVENVNVKAHKREIAVEAIRVIKRLPKLKKPGYLNGEPVNVPFSILITLYFN